MKTIKKDSESKQEINTESSLEEEKNEKRKHGESRYHNMSEEKKQRLKEYQKGYRVAKKSQSNQENSFDLC